MAVGDRATARDATLFLFERQQQADGSMPRNSLVNGKTAPDSFGTQLDETAYPLLMADELHLTDASLYANHIKPAANFVASHGPAFGSERWEEQDGYSPSTIAAEIAGLIAAAHLADLNHDPVSAAVWRGVADDYQRSIKGWTVTTNGPLAPRYFIRLSKTGDPNAAISYNVGNGGPTLDQRSVIDAGFLELARLGELSATDPDILASLPVVDATIRSNTASGSGWHRYNGDGYGDRASDGRPWAPSGQGTGHLWPALSSERAEQSLQTGDATGATALLDGMDKFAGGVSLIPEQDWETARPRGVSVWNTAGRRLDRLRQRRAGRLGKSAQLVGRVLRAPLRRHRRRPPPRPAAKHVPALRRAHAGHDAADGHEPGRPERRERLTGHRDGHDGARKRCLRHGHEHGRELGDDELLDDGRRRRGAFSLSVAVTGGTTVLNVVAVSASGGTAHVKRTVVFDFVPGTLLLDVTDPSNDDNGPGNYAYPTSGNFHPGAFDIQQFQVFDDGTNAIFRVKVRDLSPTFGSPLGAQLVDVYVHDPAAAAGSTSTAAANASRNFQIAPAYAWSRLIQVQGFGQRYENAAGTPLGTVAISANQISHFITFRVPKASLGSPGPGWSFTVVLTGQDGFSGDQARGFQSTPQDFQFGVCAVASADPHCTVNPGTVPKAVDVIPPTGVLQSDELDYTRAQPGRAAGRRDPLGRRSLELVDLDLPHLQHRRHDPLRLLLVWIGDQLDQALGDDLPRDAEPVLQPAARALLPTLGQRAPVGVDLFLALAVHLEGDGLGEPEVGPAVQRDELLAVQLEADRHHHPLGARPGRAIAGDLEDLRVREHRGVERRGLFAFGVEPQTWSELLHVSSFLEVSVVRRWGPRELIGRATGNTSRPCGGVFHSSRQWSSMRDVQVEAQRSDAGGSVSGPLS